MSEQQPIEDLANEIVVTLYSGQTEDGKAFYCYVKTTMQKFGAFTLAQEAGQQVDITQLGEIIQKGWGSEPSKEVHEAIEAEYGQLVGDE